MKTNNNTRHCERSVAIQMKQTSFSRKFRGFTLVELIVVITILVILGTIAFLDLSGYSASARDSSRVSDITNLTQALDITSIKSGSYPIPTNGTGVTFSGGLVWTQGTIGDSVINVLSSAGGKFSKKPTDPKYSTIEYTYSLLNTGREYQLAAAMEDSATAYNPIITPVYAATDSLTAYLKGNYNGLIAKVSTGITIYYLTLPSIVLQNLTNTELSVPATMSGNLVLNKKGNLPASYTAGAITSNTPSITFNALSNSNLLTIGSGIVAFTIPTTTTLNSTGVTTMMNNLYNIYSTSNISSDTTSASQIASLITGGTGTTALTNLYNGVVSKSVGGSIVTTSTALLTAPTWTVAGGGDCIYVDNTQGIDTNTATCTDNRTYTHIGVGATHTKTYNLLKIAGKWWFNQNLAYPLATGYQGTNTWSTSDLGYYSCPGTNSTTTVDCASVSTLGYLYQWSAATGVASNNNDATTFQGICPTGWHIPKKSDFTSASSAYWPATDTAWLGATTGWTRSYAGCRSIVATGTFYDRTTFEYVWSSFEASAVDSWYEYFYSGYPSPSYRNSLTQAYGFSVRCLKN